MSADTHPPAKQDERLSLGPTQLGAAIAVAAAVTLAARYSGGAALVVAVTAIAVLVPRGYGWNVRGPIAAMAGLLTLFIVRMWPDAATTTIEAPPPETGHLLTWLIAFPLVGAIGVLFVPRQAHATLKAGTLALMAVTFLLALPLLSVPMGRGFHLNEDVLWMPRFGIHYHVAIDGISLWLIMLTVFIVPIATYASFGSIQMRL